MSIVNYRDKLQTNSRKKLKYKKSNLATLFWKKEKICFFAKMGLFFGLESWNLDCEQALGLEIQCYASFVPVDSGNGNRDANFFFKFNIF